MRFHPRDVLTFAEVDTEKIEKISFFGLRYVLRMWVLAFVPTLVISFVAVAAYIIVGLSAPRYPPPTSALTFIFGSLVFSPLVETAIMIPIIYLIKRVFHRLAYIAAVSGALWGLSHALFAWPAGLWVAWPFFVFTLCFVAWRPISLGLAYWYTAACHMLYNAGLGILIGLAAILK